VGADLKRVQAVFLAAAEEASGADRSALLDRECGGDAELRQQVEALLNAHDAPGSFLDRPALGSSPTENELPSGDQDATQAPCTESVGTVIGNYKLLEQIGEGGFGVVFLAEQNTPVHRKVALKVLKPGMDTRQVITRFEAERQALAIMDHPNIAKVHDGGATPSGRPYFVMELVKGVPITEFCDDNHLTLPQRLELFVAVCQAVQHAHQKGIIHRDLKPSNILVTVHDTRPVPKIIDFGIAKALGVELTDKTLFTGFAQMIGTPLYMSPEQAGQSGLDIDTRSDIYSLGVLLYELLTGTTPFEKERFKRAAHDEIRRIIREEEPPKPSTRLSELDKPGEANGTDSKTQHGGTTSSLASVSALRQTEPAKLTKLMRRELDWIVMKALEKDRNRRYETANGFAMDVQRYLADEPVQACPPSAGYRLRKFARRNKAALLTASVLSLTLILGTAISIWQAIRATQAEGLAAERLEDEREARREADIQRKAAEAARNKALANLQKARDAVKQFLTQAGSIDLAHVPQMEAVRRKLLEKALLFYQGLLKEEHGDDADIRFATAEAHQLVGKIQTQLGQNVPAVESFSKAHGLLTRLVDESPGVAVYRFTLAWIHYSLGSCRHAEGRTGDGEKEYGRAVQLMKELVRQDPAVEYYRRHQVSFQLAQAELAQRLGRAGEARKLRQEAIALAEKTTVDADSQRMPVMMAEALLVIANELANKGDRAEAEKLCRRAVKYAEQAVSLAPQNPWTCQQLAFTRLRLGILLRDNGKLEEAESLFRDSVAACSELTANFPATAKFRAGLAESSVHLLLNLMFQERFKEAEEVYRGSLPHAEKLVAEAPGYAHHWTVLVNHHREYGLMLVRAGRFKDAEKTYEQGMAVAEKMRATFPSDQMAQRSMVSLHRRLASVFLSTGRRAEAEAASRKAEEFEASLGK
jgi:eukaryotic-like serine/threonine-protein kinase